MRKSHIITEKTCKKCGDIKPINEFYVARKDRLPYRSAYNNECKICNRARVALNHDPIRARNTHLQRKYGITEETYQKMLLEQNNSCRICGTTEHQTRWNNFCVDHDHTTGEVRGLLCKSCNIALGEIGDNVSTLKAMIEYLGG